MPKANRLTALCFALPTLGTEGEAVPTRIPVIPAPDAQGLVKGVDGRAWRLSQPRQVAANASQPIQVDENHATQLAAPLGQASPAFGWISSLSADERGAVSGAIEWTERGLNAVKGRDYRYLSPVIEFDAASGEIVGVKSVALTNTPNFPSLALNSAQHPSTETDPMSAALITLLKLPATATEAEVVASVQSLMDTRQTALNAAASPPLDKFVPRADYDTALNARNAAETALATERRAKTDGEIATLINGALQAGKITPATAEYHRANCAREGGIEAFKAFIAQSPVIAAASDVKGDPKTNPTALNAEQLAAMTAMGVNEATFRKANGL